MSGAFLYAMKPSFQVVSICYIAGAGLKQNGGKKGLGETRIANICCFKSNGLKIKIGSFNLPGMSTPQAHEKTEETSFAEFKTEPGSIC